MTGAACVVASVWAAIRPLTSSRGTGRIVEAMGTAVLAVAFALLLGWSAARTG